MSAQTRIVITGGLGFIGSNLAKRCTQLGMAVTIYDNLDPRSGGNLFNVAPFKTDVQLVIGDITNYENLVKIVRGAELIINCAASSSHPYSMEEPWLNLDVNSRGVINLLEAVRNVNPDATLVHVGTTTQFGPLHYQPADELHPEFPAEIYSANKSVSEKYVLIYAKTYGLRASVIRLPNTYGARAAIHSPEFTFNNYFIGIALQNKPITVFHPGNQMRNILYVGDAVEALLLAGQSEQSIGEAFLATGDEHFSVKEIAEQTCAVLGGSVQLADWPPQRKAIEVGDAVFTNNKIKNILGWEPKVNLKEGLRLTREYFSKCLDQYL